MINIFSKLKRITSNQLYIPEIDGIRFVAVALVIIYHVYMYFISHSTVRGVETHSADYRILATFLENCDRGVDMFFVLSGFVLCLPFAHHYLKEGPGISLKKYYLRRLTRLEPPYIVALSCIFFMQLAFSSNDASRLVPSWLASLIYSHGPIYHTESLITVVVWSLEIEIQFYILAPLFFKVFALGTRPRRLLLIAAIICSVGLQRQFVTDFVFLFNYLHLFLTGMLLADLYVSQKFVTLLKKRAMIVPAIICFLGVMFLPIRNTTMHWGSLFSITMLQLAMVLVLYYAILQNEALKRVFSYRFVPLIGGMCYSVYLLHYTIISAMGRFTHHLHITEYYWPNFIFQLALFTIPIVLISGAFFYYVERPFMSSHWLNTLMGKFEKKAQIEGS